MLGARQLAMFPQVPLLRNVGIGIALVSYDGTVCWGFNGDAGLVPDMAEFVDDIRASFADVADAAGVVLAEDAPSPADPAADRPA